MASAFWNEASQVQKLYFLFFVGIFSSASSFSALKLSESPSALIFKTNKLRWRFSFRF